MRNSTEKLVKDIRRHTRKKYSAEEKIRIVLEGLRGEDSIAELCRKESNTYASITIHCCMDHISALRHILMSVPQQRNSYGETHERPLLS